MRNDTVERTFNDSMLTISDYFLQMIEQAKRQKAIEMGRHLSSEKEKLHRGSPPLSTKENGEAEYDLYYAIIKDRHPDLFDIKGHSVETFSIDKDRVFQIYRDKDNFFGVYKQENKEAHKITPGFSSKKDVLQNTLGTARYEKFRTHSFFLIEDGKGFSLHENKHLRMNLENPYITTSTYENIEQARLAVVKEELKHDPKLLKQALRRTSEDYHIPSDLLGMSVTLNSITKDDKGVRLSFDGNQRERDVVLPDIDQKWIKRVRDNSRIRVMFDEVIMDSQSIAEGFLNFYGLEINKEIQTKQHDFEVITNEEGSYIGKLTGNGTVKKISPYYSEKEANEQLESLNIYLQTEKVKGRQVQKDPTIELLEISEGD